jgi:spoIIIJ-associated protein
MGPRRNPCLHAPPVPRSRERSSARSERGDDHATRPVSPHKAGLEKPARVAEATAVMDESARLQIEATGETVGEAKWSALRELEKLQPGLDKAAVKFQVVSEGERGLLGVGFAPTRVIATVAAGDDANGVGEAADDSELAATVRELLGRIVRELGVHAQLTIEEDDETLTAAFSGRDLGLLIGKHGQTIDAIQYLANAIVYRGQAEDRKAIVVDAAGYRERRKATLDALAVRSAERAVSSGQRVELEPMTAVERKVVHLRLKDYPGVMTASEGTEPNRFVVIAPGG